MSMFEDMNMYYSDSWLALEVDGKILPFFIECVSFGGEDEDDSESHHYYLDQSATLSSSVFQGYAVLDGTGATRHYHIYGDDDRLIFEPQNLGYYCHNGCWKWTTYTTNHSVKKGLTPQRMYHRVTDNCEYYHMFNSKPDGQVMLHKDVVLVDNILHYKGAEIGKQQGDVISILPEFSFFLNWLQGLIPSCQLTTDSDTQI